MKVTIYGVRGSIPVPGPTTLRYGGNTVCVGVVLADGSQLFVDAGTGLRILGEELVAGGFEGGVHFLLSHRHYDHIIGLPFFAPIYSPSTEIFIYPLTNEVVERRRPRADIFDGIQTPLHLDQLGAKFTHKYFGDEAPWRIGSARVRRIKLNHPGGAQGFRIDDADGSSFTYLTDNELNPPGAPVSTPAEQAEFARHTGLLIADAQYLPEDLPSKRGWGHSTVPEVLELGREAAPLCQLLFHHDPRRTDDQLDKIAAEAARFAESEMTRGPILAAMEGMSFDVSADSVVRIDHKK
jgi:phosphoribosyl 1,2-cyclic phosphodiesterase